MLNLQRNYFLLVEFNSSQSVSKYGPFPCDVYNYVPRIHFKYSIVNLSNHYSLQPLFNDLRHYFVLVINSSSPTYDIWLSFNILYSSSISLLCGNLIHLLIILFLTPSHLSLRHSTRPDPLDSAMPRRWLLPCRDRS